MTNFRKYLLLSLTVALLNAFLLLVFFVPRFNHTDTQQYISTIDYILGKGGGELFLHRILKPLPILISVFLNPILSPANSLIFQNLIFYFLSVLLIFLIVFRIYQNEKQAFYATVLYVGAYPMLAYGLAVLTDLSGWFFYLFSILISLNFLKKNSFKTALSAGFVAGLGMLFKESTAAAPIFFASLVFIATQLKVKEKLKYIFVFGAAFLLPVLINSFFIYKIYSYSYLHWYRDVWHHQEGGIYAYSSLRILIEIGRVFALGWVFVLLGVLKEFSIKNKERLKILIAFLFASLSFFLWSFPHNRIIFIAAPILTFLGSFGLLRKTNNPKINTVIELILLSFYVLVNYFLLEFLLRYGIFLQNKF